MPLRGQYFCRLDGILLHKARFYPVPYGLDMNFSPIANASHHIRTAMKTKTRCPWGESQELYARYHDVEWGVPVHDDRALFEMLLLEGAQAGLTWLLILKRRETYRAAFDNFDAEKIARYDAAKIEALLQDHGIVRNRLKVEGAVKNAKAVLELRKEFGSFDAYLWQFVGGAPIINRRATVKDIPTTTPESDAMAKDLHTRGFTFVGSTICYAFMQATGMVNDHLLSCFRYEECR